MLVELLKENNAKKKKTLIFVYYRGGGGLDGRCLDTYAVLPNREVFAIEN